MLRYIPTWSVCVRPAEHNLFRRFVESFLLTKFRLNQKNKKYSFHTRKSWIWRKLILCRKYMIEVQSKGKNRIVILILDEFGICGVDCYLLTERPDGIYNIGMVGIIVQSGENLIYHQKYRRDGRISVSPCRRLKFL